MEIEVKTLNADGSLVFQGKLDQAQIQFILGVGINVLLANGAASLQEDDEDDEFVINAPTTETVQ
jgi:hypothetical protein